MLHLVTPTRCSPSFDFGSFCLPYHRRKWAQNPKLPNGSSGFCTHYHFPNPTGSGNCGSHLSQIAVFNGLCPARRLPSLPQGLALARRPTQSPWGSATPRRCRPLVFAQLKRIAFALTGNRFKKQQSCICGCCACYFSHRLCCVQWNHSIFCWYYRRPQQKKRGIIQHSTFGRSHYLFL